MVNSGKTLGQKMCVNQFYPIQPNSYWSLQMLFVSLPIMIFMVYCKWVQILRLTGTINWPLS